MRTVRTIVAAVAALSPAAGPGAQEPPKLPRSTHNLLVDARASGNLESYDKGLRGAADHMIYDLQRRRFVKRSQWAEYGVGFGEDLGVVAEGEPAWWMAEWPEPVDANLIVLSGVYPNQPQPDTAWKIERRREGEWTTHARGIGDWYNTGRYVWGGPGTEPIRFDALRVSVFSKDEETPIKSIHFRGEEGLSWIVAHCAPIDARLNLPGPAVYAGREARFDAAPLLGEIESWKWDFGDGAQATGREASHTYEQPGTYDVTLRFSDGEYSAKLVEAVSVAPPIEALIRPLDRPAMAGEPVTFKGHAPIGKAKSYEWDFGDGELARGREVRHVFSEAGIYQVKLTVSDGQYSDECRAIVRAHTDETLNVPQVALDTDQKNEQDDQHYLGYGLFSELDVLGVNSTHHGGGQEAINYGEIIHVLDLAKQSGLPDDRVPFVFHGADEPLEIPGSGDWRDTRFVLTEASEAILAAARGASPTNPAWVVPVGPGTNVAVAVLQARAEGLDLADRLRVMWLGGSNEAITGEFNGNNDPWGTCVVTQSGLETWIMPAPVGARVRIDKRTEGDLYADHPLGQYLRQIVPARNKPLFDPACLAAIISERLGLGWIREVEPVTVGGPADGYRWSKADEPTTVRIIRQIDQEAMKADIFQTMKGERTRLHGAPAPASQADGRTE